MTMSERLVEQAEAVQRGVEERGCVDWMRRRLPDDAISLSVQLPPLDTEVLGWVSDPNVAIHYFPTVIRRRHDEIWAGLPGSWIPLAAKRWTLTHWRPL